MRSRKPVTLLLAGGLSALGAVSALLGLTGAERLEGVVVDGGGTPAAGVVVIMNGRGVRHDTLTQNGGGFIIEPVAPGVYLLSATAGNIASEEIRVEIREDEAPAHVTLVLKPTFLASAPIAGRPEICQAGAHLPNDCFETGRASVVTPSGSPGVAAGVRPRLDPAPPHS